MVHIVILEDNQAFGDMMQISLEEAGYSVRLFATADELLQSFDKKPADVLIADMIIREQGKPTPEGGLTTIFRVRQLALRMGRRVYSIAISGATRHPGMQDILGHARTLGADWALQKPFHPSELIELIDKLALDERR
ncbi:response regulator [Vannielia litorea]|uniref:response regulator n=1 Tax=Vannielia litorea TaxID=1217970 RepID=UPI001C9423B1|nr:response regulator [Vannielia litorea]MBY6046699.1 response regulator [Vannielia litorea]MBY6074113.1 response regulator [Vannielia litorea]